MPLRDTSLGHSEPVLIPSGMTTQPAGYPAGDSFPFAGIDLPIGPSLNALGGLLSGQAPALSGATGTQANPNAFNFIDAPLGAGSSKISNDAYGGADASAEARGGPLTQSDGQGSAGQRLENIALIVGIVVAAIAITRAL